jgi:hypothetical protein
MCDDTCPLPIPLPPPALIHARLTQIAREQKRLRTLLHVVLEQRAADDDRRAAAPESRQPAAGGEATHAAS